MRSAPKPSTRRLSRDPRRSWRSAVAVGVGVAAVVFAAPIPAAAASGTRFYAFPFTQAARHQHAAGRQGVVARELARVPQAVQVSNDPTRVRVDVRQLVTTAARHHAVPVLIGYDVPMRDCGSYSAGGARSDAEYRRWARGFAAGLGSHRAIVVLEPDALAQMSDCLTGAQQRNRERLISYAVHQLARHRHARVYLDAGHSRWRTVRQMAARLKAAGVAAARGFSLNVSNFQTTAGEQRYGEQISQMLHGKHYVIDTSRNGRGPGKASKISWCNPPGRALGQRPTAVTTAEHADAYLWIKQPGQSDGNCRPGSPRAGGWDGKYAVMLARNAGWRS